MNVQNQIPNNQKFPTATPVYPTRSIFVCKLKQTRHWASLLLLSVLLLGGCVVPRPRPKSPLHLQRQLLQPPHRIRKPPRQQRQTHRPKAVA